MPPEMLKKLNAFVKRDERCPLKCQHHQARSMQEYSWPLRHKREKKVLETSFMFGSPRKLPRIPQPSPQTTSCWCSFHQHTSLAVDAASGALGCVPASKFTVDHASRIK